MTTERNTTKLPCGARPYNPHTPHGAALTNDLPAACRHFVPAAALCKGNQKQASVKRTVCDTRGGLTRRVSIENSPPISGLKLGIADFYGCFQATSARKSELLQNLKLGKAIWNKRGIFFVFCFVFLLLLQLQATFTSSVHCIALERSASRTSCRYFIGIAVRVRRHDVESSTLHVD